MANFKSVPVKRTYKMSLLLVKLLCKKRSAAKIRRELKEEAKEYQELRLGERMVWDVAEKSKKVGYNPETGTNWCHLPMEMRMMCINKMDLKSRIHLAATSRTEKALVEAKKLRITCVTIFCYKDTFNVLFSYKGKHCVTLYSMEASNDTKLQSAKYLFRKCDVEDFEFSGYNHKQEIIPTIAELENVVPFRCKTFSIYSDNRKVARFILNNCPQLESITFEEQNLFDNMALCKPMINIKEVCLANSHYSSGVWKLVRKWIEIDAEVGKSFKFVSSCVRIRSTILEDFNSKFADRVLKSDEKEVVIKMDGKQKLMHVLNCRHPELDHDYILIKVISSKALNSGSKRDEWIEKRWKKDMIVKEMTRCFFYF